MIVNFRKTGLFAIAGLLLVVLVSQAYSGIKKETVVEENPLPETLVSEEADMGKGMDIDQEAEFFAEYRMERERVRSRQIEMLRDILNSELDDKEARAAAAIRLVNISEDMEKEMRAESLVKSKGYSECAVIVQPDTITVIIQADNLRLDKEQELIQLIARATKSSEDKICIVVRGGTES
ncbi:MAG: SpoIIIAH-like family protein [Syntrophomonadaceae bacterium]|nr:SpoIIIAH-like family protein [Syntrophomonadaceae bacterium]